ncbi:MAG TPA: hypothetical protein PKA64_23130 [Myxococcota bacterium]|nr:hypothetical protein [Myxococcota bacterium]
MSLHQTWQRIHGAFDPLVPAGDAQHGRVERPYTPLPDILLDLDFPDGFRRELIVGASGAGKTTELLAVQRGTRDLRSVHLDLLEHFEARGDVTALDRLEAWEVLLLIGLSLYRYGVEGLGHAWTSARPAALTSAIAGVTGQEPAALDLAGMIGEVALVVSESTAAAVPGVAPALRALRSVTSHLTATLQLGAPRRSDPALADGDPRVHALLVAVNGMLVELYQVFHTRLLLLVDGIDRGGPDLARRLFEDSTLLAQLNCHAVMTAPLSLRHRNLRVWRSRFLGNVPVLDPNDPMRPAARVDFFRALWRDRATAAGGSTLLTDPLVDRLAWASGGLVRQFCELVQGVSRRGYRADAPADAAMVDAEIDDWRRRWEADLDASTVALLREVLRLRALTGDEGERALLDQRCIVAWPNDSTWYFPHPLLLLRKVRPPDAP